MSCPEAVMVMYLPFCRNDRFDGLKDSAGEPSETPERERIFNPVFPYHKKKLTSVKVFGLSTIGFRGGCHPNTAQYSVSFNSMVK